jgi:CHAD domain-containing protein
MAFELKPCEPVPKALKRIARKQIDKALDQLAGDRRDAAIHEARKCFKKVRAVLRFVRPKIGTATYRDENTCFRDAGRPLTEVRDAKVLIETLDKLLEHFAEQLSGKSFAAVRQQLQDERRQARQRVLDEQDAVTTVTAAVRQARDRLRDWTDVPDRWSSLGAGLKRVYQRGAAAFADACADPTVDKLHQWRKQTKYLRYQLEIFQPIWPEVMEELAHQADRVGELLGDDHDLSVLRQKLLDDPERFGGDSTVETLTDLIDRRRLELQREARLLGERLFQDSNNDLGRRLKGYWQTWQTEGARGLAAAAS